MDALIMAAGRGSRLGGLAADRPKSLIDLGGITPLELQLDVLTARGVSRAVLVTGYRRDLLQAAAEQRAAGRIELEFVFNPFWSVTNVLGSAWFARDRLRDDFVYAHADTVFDPTILDDLLQTDADIALPVDMRACEPEQMKAEVSGDRVVHLSKDLPEERTCGEFIGIGLFRSRIVPGLVGAIEREVADGAIGSYFEAAINRLIADDGAAAVAVPTRGRAWTEIDFAEDLETARRLLPAFREAPPA
jgi:choline kinase